MAAGAKVPGAGERAIRRQPRQAPLPAGSMVITYFIATGCEAGEFHATMVSSQSIIALTLRRHHANHRPDS